MGIKMERSQVVESKLPSQLIIECGYESASNAASVSLNKPLAEKLLSMRPRMRSMQIEKAILAILNDSPENTIVKDFDVMFNPNYGIDVLATLISIYKQKHIRVKWPGRIVGYCLVYGEEGYADYKTFDINDYDIVCIY